MNKRSGILAAVVLALCAFVAKAGVFEYSYTFHEGTVVRGTLTGNVSADGMFIENISNISAYAKGVPFNGNPTLFTAYFDGGTPPSGWNYHVPPVVSFDANLNNFMFVDSDIPNAEIYTNYFSIPAICGYHARVVMEDMPAPPTLNVWDTMCSTDPDEALFDAARWSLADVTSETATTQIDNLVTTIMSLDLAKGITNALTVKLNKAVAALPADEGGSYAGTCDYLRAVINQIKAQSGKQIAIEQANQLIAETSSIEMMIGCP